MDVKAMAMLSGWLHRRMIRRRIFPLDYFQYVLGRLNKVSGSSQYENRWILKRLISEGLLHIPHVGAKYYSHYLATYELYKKILPVPGHIVEVGVYRGRTTILFAYLIELFGEVSRDRNIYGFDTFQGHPHEQVVEEGNESVAKFENTSLDFVREVMRRANATEYVHFIEGDVVHTLPIFLANHPDFKVALLYNDCNLYTPTKAVLENLLPRMQPGGIIYLDSYNNPSQHGETRAADEVLSRYGLVLQKDLPPLSQPAYCVIPESGFGIVPDS